MTSQRLSPFDIMCHLVAFPTISKDSNLPLIDWVETYLRSHHIIPHRCYNDEKDKLPFLRMSGPKLLVALFYQGIAMWCPLRGNFGSKILGRCCKKTTDITGVAPAI